MRFYCKNLTKRIKEVCEKMQNSLLLQNEVRIITSKVCNT